MSESLWWNPFRVQVQVLQPRVARSSQPRAGGRNPFGIGKALNTATRSGRGEDLSRRLRRLRECLLPGGGWSSFPTGPCHDKNFAQQVDLATSSGSPDAA